MTICDTVGGGAHANAELADDLEDDRGDWWWGRGDGGTEETAGERGTGDEGGEDMTLACTQRPHQLINPHQLDGTLLCV